MKIIGSTSTPLEALYVYQYYFNDISNSMKIWEKTLHIAFLMFTYGYLNLGLSRDQLKLLAVTALLTASKLDELDDNIPFLEDLQSHASKSSNLTMITKWDEL